MGGVTGRNSKDWGMCVCVCVCVAKIMLLGIEYATDRHCKNNKVLKILQPY